MTNTLVQLVDKLVWLWDLKSSKVSWDQQRGNWFSLVFVGCLAGLHDKKSAVKQHPWLLARVDNGQWLPSSLVVHCRWGIGREPLQAMSIYASRMQKGMTMLVITHDQMKLVCQPCPTKEFMMTCTFPHGSTCAQLWFGGIGVQLLSGSRQTLTLEAVAGGKEVLLRRHLARQAVPIYLSKCCIALWFLSFPTWSCVDTGNKAMPMRQATRTPEQ